MSRKCILLKLLKGVREILLSMFRTAFGVLESGLEEEEEQGLGQGLEQRKERARSRSTFNKAITFDEGYCRMGDNTASLRIKQGPLQRPL